MPGTFGQLLSRGDRSRAASFGARCGGAGMAGIGRIRNSSSIQTTLIRKLFLRSSAGSPVDFTQHPCGSSLSLGRAVLVTPAMLEVIIVQTVRGSMVCNRSDKEFRKLRIARAYIKLLCLPQGDGRFVSLVRIGSYEVRMLDASQTGSAAKPLFCLELIDHDGKTPCRHGGPSLATSFC
jgi:hypothetical protein